MTFDDILVLHFEGLNPRRLELELRGITEC